MLILLLAGCEAATVAKEYALNNLDSNQAWGVSATSRLLAQPGLVGNVDAVANVVQAREEYMLATIDMLDKQLGGVERYLVEYLGFEKDTIFRIKANLLI